MVSETGIQSAIQSNLLEQGPCSLQVLLDRLPQFSWSEMFAAIDHLSREGNLVLRHPSQFEYELSMGPVQMSRNTSERPSTFHARQTVPR
ncbi:hypothetical protein [Nitrospira sp. KM1]|uniref:hypothetical protein n=1 Tax=Nitrospira sp. KM1 TaxID=1936990 RepID=UPI0015631886|nr:hypothetical protein [Nitrospira sp. KM1]